MSYDSYDGPWGDENTMPSTDAGRRPQTEDAVHARPVEAAAREVPPSSRAIDRSSPLSHVPCLAARGGRADRREGRDRRRDQGHLPPTRRRVAEGVGPSEGTVP